MEVKVVPYRTCVECSKLLKLFKGLALKELIKERMGLMRCVGCVKLNERSKKNDYS